MDATRRKLLLTVSAAALVGAGMGGMPSCSGVDIPGLISTVAQLIEKIQQGVRDKLTGLCTVATNSLVPTVDTVFAVIAQLLGIVPTAIGQNLAKAVTFVQKSIDTIVAAGCPPAPGAKTATVNGKELSIKFY